MSGKASATQPVSIRFTADELAELKQQAATRGVSMAAHVHDMTLVGMARHRPGVTVRHLPSGAELIAYPPGGNP